MIFQFVYVPIINFIESHLISKIKNKKIKSIILFVLCLVLAYFFLTREISNFSFIFPENKRSVLGILMLLIIIFSIDGPVEKEKINKPYNLLYLFVGLSLFVFSNYYLDSYKYTFLSFSMLVFFPCMYIIWNNRMQWEKLFDYISIVSTIIVNYYISFFYDFAKEGKLINNVNKLIATASNSNDFSFFLISGFLSGIYLLYRFNKNNIQFLYISLSLSFCCTCITKTQCRTSFLVMVISIICLLIFFIKNYKRNKIKINKIDFIIKLTILISSMLIAWFSITNTITLNNQSVNYRLLDNVDKNSTVIDRLKIDKETNDSLYDFINKTIAGRLFIWKCYFKQMKFLGNPFEDVLRDGAPVEAHNILVDIIYRYGYITGLLFSIWYILNIFKCIKILFSKKKTSAKYLFMILMIFGYFFISMLDTVYTADRFIIGYCFYVSIGLLCTKHILDI